MARHLSFWIGFFAAALVIVPVAVGAWGVTQGFARDWAATFFIVITTLVSLLVLALLFRGAILRRLTGRAEATVEDISTTLISGVSAAVAQDRAAAEREADKLARVVLGWYAWSSFYRWVIGTALALLLAFASFTGTVLLFEQIAKLEDQTRVMQAQQELMDAQTRFMESQTLRLQEQTEQAQMQNEIMTLNLVNQLRDQMLASIQQVTIRKALENFGLHGLGRPLLRASDSRTSCEVDFDDTYLLNTPPSPPIIGAIKNLVENEALGARVKSALQLLVQDPNGGVALGAMLVLEAAGHPFVEADVVLNDLIVTDRAVLPGPHYSLNVRNSLLVGFSCRGCQINAVGSFLSNVGQFKLSGYGNLLLDSTPRTVLNGFLVADKDWQPHEDLEAFELQGGAMVLANDRAWLVGLEMGSVCAGMAQVDRINRLLTVTPAK